jgi:dihydroorotase
MKIQPQHTICIQGGHVFDPSENLNTVMDVYIENDCIVALGTAPEGFSAQEVIDASGKMIFPGFIDINAFLAEPGFTQKGSIQTETLAAAKSGITTLCCTPNTKPSLDSSAQVTMVRDKAKQAGFCHVLPIGALTAGLKGEQLSNMHGLKEAGCIALSNHDTPFKDSHVIKQCYHYAAGFNITVMVTPLDHALAQDGCMHESPTSTKLGLAGIGESAETSALAQHLILAEETGVQLHISRVTSKRALDLITAAQEKGLKVTADVALGNLVFNAEYCAGYNSLMHVSPVYRSQSDQQALIDGVNAGVLSICSNHNPQDTASKMAPFAASEKGISVLDNFSSVIFDLVNKKILTLEAAISSISSLPAKQLNIQAGKIKIEGAADLCIADLKSQTCVTSSTTASKGANNPWNDQNLSGEVICTINDGHIVFQN